MKKEIFNFYDSGEYEVGKTVFLKMMAIPIVLIILTYFGYNYAFGENESLPVDNNISLEDNNISKEYINEDDEDEDFNREDEDHLIFFNCNLENCNIRESSFTVPLKKMALFAEAVDMEIQR